MMGVWKARDASPTQRSSSPQRTSSHQRQGQWQRHSTNEQEDNIKHSSATLENKPSQWSTRKGFLTSEVLMEHVMRTPEPSRVETDKDKIRNWATKA